MTSSGAKNGIFAPDEVTFSYLRERGIEGEGAIRSDPDASYKEVREYDVSQLEPQVACPPSPGNVHPVRELSQIEVDQVVIGSCTNGRLEDLREAARVLKGKKVAPYLRLIVIPATQGIYLQALREGLIEIFIEAGGAVSTPMCPPRQGPQVGVLTAAPASIKTSTSPSRSASR